MEKKNILIIQTAFLGDLILTTPFIKAVYFFYDKPEITILINKGSKEILRWNPYLYEIIEFDKKKVRSNFLYFFKFAFYLRKKKFDICISPHFSHRSSILSFLSGSTERIGYTESGFSFFHTKRIQRPQLGIHEVDKLYSLIFEDPKKYPKLKRPEIFIKAMDLKKIKSLLFKEKLNSKKYIIIAPSSIWETKKMPKEKFIILIKKILKNTSYRIVLIGSKSDVPLTESIKNEFPDRVKSFAGMTNLTELAYIIKESKAVVSNDSSPVHFASAFNIPTIAIFGATIPDFGYTPLSDKNYISEVKDLPCRPCGIHGGDFCPKKHFKCMLNQNTDIIFQKLISIIKK